MKETELNKVLNYMKQYVENKYEHDSEPMLTCKDLQLVLEEIERLKNIINEIEKYAGLGEVNWEDKYQDIMLSSKGLLKRIKELKGDSSNE